MRKRLSSQSYLMELKFNKRVDEQIQKRLSIVPNGIEISMQCQLSLRPRPLNRT